MSMTFQFLVTVEVSRTQGKFATREELAEQIRAELEGADPGSLEGAEGGEYTVESFDVADHETPKRPRRRRATRRPPADEPGAVFHSVEGMGDRL